MFFLGLKVQQLSEKAKYIKSKIQHSVEGVRRLDILADGLLLGVFYFLLLLYLG